MNAPIEKQKRSYPVLRINNTNLKQCQYLKICSSSSILIYFLMWSQLQDSFLTTFYGLYFVTQCTLLVTQLNTGVYNLLTKTMGVISYCCIKHANNLYHRKFSMLQLIHVSWGFKFLIAVAHVLVIRHEYVQISKNSTFIHLAGSSTHPGHNYNLCPTSI